MKGDYKRGFLDGFKFAREKFKQIVADDDVFALKKCDECGKYENEVKMRFANICEECFQSKNMGPMFERAKEEERKRLR